MSNRRSDKRLGCYGAAEHMPKLIRFEATKSDFKRVLLLVIFGSVICTTGCVTDRADDPRSLTNNTRVSSQAQSTNSVVSKNSREGVPSPGKGPEGSRPQPGDRNLNSSNGMGSGSEGVRP